MSGNAQWVAYRAAEGAWLKAPLPSAPEIGPGWRGVELRRFHPLDQLDALVIDTAKRVGAAIGVAEAGDDFGYVIAAAERSEPVRLVVGVDPADPGEAADILAHARPGREEPNDDAAEAAEALTAWSRHAPAPAEAARIAPLLAPEVPVERALSGILALLQLALPIEPIPDPLDLQGVARGEPAGGDAPTGTTARAGRRRWFSRGA